MMKKFLALLFFLCSLLVAGDDAPEISLLPEKKIVSGFTASGSEHRISYAKLLNDGMFVGSMGGSFPVADVKTGSWMVQISAASSVYTTLQNAGVKFRVTNVDFYVDLFFDFPVADRTIVRAGWGHTSHHLADDAMAPGIVPVNYARDFYSLYAVQSFPLISGSVYGGVQWTYSFLIDRNIGRRLMPHFGGEAAIASLGNGLVLYGACDVKFRGELRYGSTQSLQVGVKSQTVFNRALRLAYTFRTGTEERGQFYSLRNEYHSIGLFFDF